MPTQGRALRLTMVSHGATAATRLASFPADEGLEDRAHAALPEVRLRLGKPERVLASPALAARQTAAALQLSATIEPSLGDWDYGRWAGLTIAEVGRLEPDALAGWRRDPDVCPHGGETLNQLLARVGQWLDRQTTATGDVLAITHASVIRGALVAALGAGAPAFWHVDAGPFTVLSLNHAGGRWLLRSISPA